MSLCGSQVEVSVLLKTKEYSHIINRSNAITANTSNTNIKMSIVPTNVHSCGKINIHISILLLGAKIGELNQQLQNLEKQEELRATGINLTNLTTRHAETDECIKLRAELASEAEKVKQQKDKTDKEEKLAKWQEKQTKLRFF